MVDPDRRATDRRAVSRPAPLWVKVAVPAAAAALMFIGVVSTLGQMRSTESRDQATVAANEAAATSRSNAGLIRALQEFQAQTEVEARADRDRIEWLVGCLLELIAPHVGQRPAKPTISGHLCENLTVMEVAPPPPRVTTTSRPQPTPRTATPTATTTTTRPATTTTQRPGPATTTTTCPAPCLTVPTIPGG